MNENKRRREIPELTQKGQATFYFENYTWYNTDDLETLIKVLGVPQSKPITFVASGGAGVKMADGIDKRDISLWKSRSRWWRAGNTLIPLRDPLKLPISPTEMIAYGTSGLPFNCFSLLAWQLVKSDQHWYRPERLTSISMSRQEVFRHNIRFDAKLSTGVKRLGTLVGLEQTVLRGQERTAGLESTAKAAQERFTVAQTALAKQLARFEKLKKEAGRG